MTQTQLAIPAAHGRPLRSISTVILGTDDTRLEKISALIRDVSESVRVFQVLEAEIESLDLESVGLILLADAAEETLAKLDEILDYTDRTVLTFACLPVSEVDTIQDKLLDHVDDILLHPEELALRLPFVEQRLHKREESQRQNRAILETIVDGILTIDSRGIINTFNPSAEKIFGYSAHEVIGKAVAILMPQPWSSKHQSYIQEYERTGQARIIGIGREVVGLRKNGEQFPMDLAVSEVNSEGQKFYTGVVRDITDRRQLEHEILRITDQERRRIGQDLHDGLGQMLTGIGLIARSLVTRMEQEGSSHIEEMREVTELMKEADRNARTIARGLVPVELDVNGLEHALRMLVTDVEQLFGSRCTFHQSGTVPVLEMSAMTNLYRIAQESLSNAIKHGNADSVRIELQSKSGKLTLSIIDDGIGFSEDLPKNQGMGIPIMNYRARAIGATLEIGASGTKGTTVTCSLPVE
ncbi:MAG: hypothetical protein BMS9Abin05_0270 [Rhodothermia bacterium]|nr:MAG: hypothetical protein BMS9Abin05_0270 [Rhodothermia bacterium]